MGIKQLYQLHDRESGIVGGPIMAAHRAAPAIREFHAVLADKDTQPGKYPEHFVLLRVGEQDEETGQITGGPPEVVTTGEAWLHAQQPRDRGASANSDEPAVRSAPLSSNQTLGIRNRDMEPR